jgi:hypothetical protein
MSTLLRAPPQQRWSWAALSNFAKLVGASLRSRSWSTAFPPLRWAILAMVVALMGLIAMGCYGYLTRAHLQSRLAGQIDVDSRATPVAQRIENKTAIVADLNRRIGQTPARPASTIGTPSSPISRTSTPGAGLPEEPWRRRDGVLVKIL